MRVHLAIRITSSSFGAVKYARFLLTAIGVPSARMRSEGYSTWSARKLGSNLLYQGGKGGREEGERGRVKVQIEEGYSSKWYI